MAVANVVAKFEADISDVQAKMATLKKSFSEAGDSANNLSARFKTIGTEMSRVGKGMTIGLTLPLAAVGAAAVKASVDFESSMAKIVGLVGIAADEVDVMKESVLALSGETAKSPVELANGLFVVTSAGLRGEEAMQALEMSARAGAAGLGETNDIARAVAGALSAYGSDVLSAADATDQIVATARAGNFETSQFAAAIGRVLPFAQQAGASFADMGGAVALLTRVNGDAAQSVTQMAALFRAFVVPTEEAKKALADVGMSAGQLRDSIAKQGLPATLKMLDEALGGNREQLGRLLGSSEAASAAFQILNADAQTIGETFGVVADSAGMTQEAFDAAANTAGFKMQQAMVSLKATLIQIGDILVPLITRFARFAKVLLDGFQSLPGPIKKVVVAFAGIVAALGPILWIGGKVVAMFGTIAAAFVAAKVKIVVAVGVLRGTFAAMVLNIKAAMIAARTQFGALVAGIRAGAATASAAVKGMAVAMKGALISTGIGAVLVGIGIALESFMSSQAEAEAAVDSLTDAMKEQNAVMGEAVAMKLAESMQEVAYGFAESTKFVDDLELLGVTLEDAVLAAMQGGPALQEFAAEIRGAAEGNRELEVAAANVLGTLAMENEKVNEARAQYEAYNAAKKVAANVAGEAAASTRGYTSATVEAAIAAGNAIGPTQSFSGAVDTVTDAAGNAVTQLDMMKQEYTNWLTVTGQISAVDSAAASIDRIGASAVEFGTNLMGQTPKARDFRADVVAAFEDSARAAQSLSDDLPTQRAIFTGELIKIVAALRASGVKPKDIEAFLGSMNGLPASVADIMRSAAKAIGDTDFKTEIEKAFKQSVKNGTPMTADTMEQLAIGASKAAKDKLGLTLEPELASIIKSGTTALRPTAFNNGQLTGKSMGSGVANGISASSPIVVAAIERVMANAHAAAQAAIKATSPSRLFAETGDDITAGIGMGITRSTRKATGAIVNVVAAISKQMNKLLTGITKMIDREMKAASDAGKEQLQKFLDAVTKTFDAFKARMQTLREISKEWTDFTKGVRETTPTLESSLARVDNLYRRIEKSVSAKGTVTDKTVASVRRMAEALRNELATALDIAQSDLDAVQGKFDDLKDTVAGAIRGILSFSDARAIGEEIGGGFLEGLRIQAEKAAAFAAIIDQLRRQGLSEEALRLVIQAGAEAGTAIGSELIAGGTEAIQEANDLVASVGDLAEQIGMDTADQFYGAGVAAAQAQVEGILDQIDKMTPQIMRWMDKLAKKMKRQTIIEVKLSQDKFKVTIDVDKVVREIIAGEGTTVRATAMAAGGIVTRPTFAMVGEAGPEAVIPLSQASRYGIGPDESNKYFTIENLNVHSSPGERSEDTVPRALRRMAFAMGYDD